MTTTYITYLRVSTSKQAASHLGLDSQQQIVRDYVVQNSGILLHEVVEVESGKKDNRPELKRALDLCKKHNAVLLLPRLDRLSRSVSFISRLMDGGVRFTVCNMPHATDFMLHIYSAVAQEERRLIGERTRNALAAAKARGTVLGANGKALAKHNHEAALAYAEGLRSQIAAIRTEGARTLAQVTDALNSAKIPTYRGGDTRWHIPQTRKLLIRLQQTA